jgi:predicted DNA-binding transcriptional regulator AlpA
VHREHERTLKASNRRINGLRSKCESQSFIAIAQQLFEPEMFHRIWGRVRQQATTAEQQHKRKPALYRRALSSGAKCNPRRHGRGSIFLLAEPSLSPGNRAEGPRSEWETRLSVEEPMLSTGLHFASESTGYYDKGVTSRQCILQRAVAAQLELGISLSSSQSPRKDQAVPSILTVPEVADIVRVSRKTVFGWLSTGNLPHIRTFGTGSALSASIPKRCSRTAKRQRPPNT